jgi:hypothetical protein
VNACSIKFMQRSNCFGGRGDGLARLPAALILTRPTSIILPPARTFEGKSHWCVGKRLAKKGMKLRPWTTVDVRMLKTLAREKTKTTVIARRLNRTVKATYQQAMRLGVTLGVRRKKRRA